MPVPGQDSGSHQRHVLEDESGRLECFYRPGKLLDESVAWIGRVAQPPDREPLTRRSTENYVDHGHWLARTPARQPGGDSRSQSVGVHDGQIILHKLAVGEVEAVRPGVRRITLDCADDIEAGLLESERHPTCTGE
jgi:hypothetical protein